MSETLKDLLEYLQNKIDSGEHKIFYNDLGWDIKTIDCINAINEQQEEIERLNNIIDKAREYIQDRYDGEVLTHTFDKDNVGELLNILKEVIKSERD